MSYKLFKEDEKSFHMLHPDGSTFQVAKKQLGDDLILHIKESYPIQKMADGGEVEDPTAALTGMNPTIDDIYSAQSTPAPSIPAAETSKEPQTAGYWGEIGDQFSTPFKGLFEKGVEQGIQHSLTPQSVEEPVATPPAEIVPPTATQKLDTTAPKEEPSAYDLQERSIGRLEESHKKQAEETAKLIQNTENQIAQERERFQQEKIALDTRDKTLTAAYETGTIDPNRVISNMSTGNKILAGISLVLGGIGAGLKGGENQALKVINNAIDRDIDAQKTQVDKQKNLLSLNLQRTGNLNSAYLMTKNDLLGALDIKIKKMAASQGGAQALAQADMMRAVIKTERDKNNAKMAQMAMSYQLGQGGVRGLNPALVADKDLAKELVILPNGITYRAQSAEEGKKVRDAGVAADNMDTLVAKMKTFAKEGPALALTQRRAVAKSLNSQLVLAAKEAYKLGVLSDSDMNLTESLASVGGLMTNQQLAKLNELSKTTRSQLENTRKNLLVGYKPVNTESDRKGFVP